MPKKDTKKAVLKKFLVSYDVFSIFILVEHMVTTCKAKI